MMDNTAIAEIQKSTVTQVLNDRLDEQITNADGGMYSSIVLPEGYKLASLESLQETRNRASGVFATNELRSFVSFVEKAASDTEAPLLLAINTADRKAVCFLNFERGLGHCDYRAEYVLKPTADYLVLTAALHNNEGKFSMNDFANFLQDNRHNVTLFDQDGNEINQKQAISAVRSVTVDKQNSTNIESSSLVQKQSSMEKLDAQTGNSHMPDTIEFLCAPYEDLASRSFQLRISLNLEDVAHGRGAIAPRFKIKLINKERVEEKINTEIVNKISAAFANEGLVDVRVGTYRP